MIFSAAQVDTAEAICAPPTVDQKRAVQAIVAALGPLQTMAVVTIIHFIRKFDFVGVRTVNQIFGKLNPVTIYAILVVGTFNNHIAIFVVGGII